MVAAAGSTLAAPVVSVELAAVLMVPPGPLVSRTRNPIQAVVVAAVDTRPHRAFT